MGDVDIYAIILMILTKSILSPIRDNTYDTDQVNIIPRVSVYNSLMCSEGW